MTARVNNPFGYAAPMPTSKDMERFYRAAEALDKTFEIPTQNGNKTTLDGTTLLKQFQTPAPNQSNPFGGNQFQQLREAAQEMAQAGLVKFNQDGAPQLTDFGKQVMALEEFEMNPSDSFEPWKTNFHA